MVVSLKANKKRILAFLLLAAVVVGACIFLRGGENEKNNQEFPGGTNEERVTFLQSYGWQLETEPVETREVMIPAQFNDVYTAYNVMQKAQGFDLKPFAGQVCTQYKYKINNYPDELEVYATLLVCGDKIVGGDIACAEVDGFMHGFAPDSARYGETGTQSSSVDDGSASESEISEESMPQSSGAEQMESSMMESSMAESAEAVPETESAEAAPETESTVESTAAEAVPEENFPTD